MKQLLCLASSCSLEPFQYDSASIHNASMQIFYFFIFFFAFMRNPSFF